MRATALIFLALLFLATPAQAGSYFRTADGNSATTYNRWARWAKVDSPDAVVTVREFDSLPLPRCWAEEAIACVSPSRVGEYEMEVYRGVSPRLRRIAFWHEMGHVYDWSMLTDADREVLTRRFGLTGLWVQDVWDSPHEHFARVYAACAAAGPVTRYEYGFEGTAQSTPFEHTFTCRLIRSRAFGV